jgi:ankyrin repeat protein
MLPLRRAADFGRAEIVKLLLEHQADPNDLWGGYPVLKDGIRYPAVVKLLLDAGAKADIEISWRGSLTGPVGPQDVGNEASPLHFAAKEDAIESARLLLDEGVKVDARDSRKQTPLHIAAWRGNAEMVALLLDHGADINAADSAGDTPLRHAGVVGNPAATVLLRRGAKLNKRDEGKPAAVPPQRTPGQR